MRLIDADALIKWIDDSVSQYGHTYSTDMLNMWGLFKDYLINNAPTVEIPNYGGQIVPDNLQGWKYEERPQGEWINTRPPEMSDNIVCSLCGYDSIASFNFCPNCGAEMKEGEDHAVD